MRTLRLSLGGVITMALLGGLGGAAVAQDPIEDYTEYTMEVSDEGSAENANVVVASDPRMSGTWTEDFRCRGDRLNEVCVGWVRVENDEGAWLGRAQRFGGDNRQYDQTVFEGEGGYAGLTALDQRSWDPGDDSEAGIIFEGELQDEVAESLLALWRDAQSGGSSDSTGVINFQTSAAIDFQLPSREYLCQQLEAWAAYVHYENWRAGILEEPSHYCD